MSCSLLPTKVKIFDLAEGLVFPQTYGPILATVTGEFSSARKLYRVGLAVDVALTLSLVSTTGLLA